MTKSRPTSKSVCIYLLYLKPLCKSHSEELLAVENEISGLETLLRVDDKDWDAETKRLYVDSARLRTLIERKEARVLSLEQGKTALQQQLVNLRKDKTILDEGLIKQKLYSQERPSSTPQLEIAPLEKDRIFFERDGIRLATNLVPRTHLINVMESHLRSSRFLLLNSPPASGKTSLLQLFASAMPSSYVFHPISCLRLTTPGIELLKEKGLDLVGETCIYGPDDPPVFYLLDDAQMKYDETTFWYLLIKKLPNWLVPTNIKFIICATHMLKLGVDSPVEFGNLPRLTRDDLAVTSEEFTKLTSAGIQFDWDPTFLKTVIANECGKLIGAIQITMYEITENFFHMKEAHPSQSDVLQYFFSEKFIERTGRCFGVQLPTPSSKLRAFLVTCFFQPVPKKHQISKKDDLNLTILNKAGVILENSNGTIGFSSPLAKRFFTKALFPNRSSTNPLSLKSLIKDSVKRLSSSLLRRSALSDSFPKEAVFQHMLMSSLASLTLPSCAILPELSEVCPDGAGIQRNKINGFIDFYLNGDLRWGIEILVKGDRVGAHIARFSPRGNYYPLLVKDYVVVDFRSGPVSDVDRHEKRVTVFFSADFSKCSCIFGMESETFELTLNP